MEEFENYLIEIKVYITQRRNKKKILIGGDFNAKAYLWGSPKEDKKGSALAEWANENKYNILNDGKIPTFERNYCTSFPDITMCSERINKFISKWYVDEEENLSYHKNI